jgi:WD40 repeat protein
MSRDARLKIFDVSDPARPVVVLEKPIEGGVDVDFISNDVAAAGTTTGVELVRTAGASERYTLPGISRWASSTREHQLALATSKGQAVVLESFPLKVAARAELCHGSTADLQFLTGRHSLAYACNDGAIGIWDLATGAVKTRAQLEGHADLITASTNGDYIIAAGGTGTVTVLDLATDVIASYRGHGFRLSTIRPPTPDQPFLVTGDAHGGIRAWPLPSRLIRVAATSSTPFTEAVFEPRSSTAIATSSWPVLTVVSPSTGARTVGPHLSDNLFLERSAGGDTFATYGLADVVEVWSTQTMTRTASLPTGHGSIAQLQFAVDSDAFLTAGRDGRLIRWTAAGDQSLVAQVDQPIDKFVATHAKAVVFSTMDGALWRTDDGRVVPLAAGGSRVNRIRELAAQHTVYAGHASGEVVAIDTATWRREPLLHGAAAVREIAVSRDGKTLAVTTNDGTVHVGVYPSTPGSGAARPGQPIWTSLALRTHHIALAPDGTLVASGADGAIWLYSPAHRRWLCLPTGTVDLGRTAIADDGKTAVTVDFEGRLIWIDLDAARGRLEADTATR